MSLDKGIKSGKEHRKSWSYCKSIAKSCRNHGGCQWCLGNRLYNTKKKLAENEANSKLDE